MRYLLLGWKVLVELRDGICLRLNYSHIVDSTKHASLQSRENKRSRKRRKPVSRGSWGVSKNIAFKRSFYALKIHT
jgi:hypothetical protein